MKDDGVFAAFPLYSQMDQVSAIHPNAFDFYYSGKRKLDLKNGEIYAEADVFDYTGINVRRVDSLDDFMRTALHEMGHLNPRLAELWRISTPGYKGRIESWPDIELQGQIHREIQENVEKLMEVYHARYRP